MELTEQERLKRSVQRRQERGPAEIAELLAKDETQRKKREGILNHHSALWNARKRAQRQEAEPSVTPEASSQPADVPASGRAPLPEGWRDQHWKTLQAMAWDFGKVETMNKAQSVAVLEAYERGEK